MEENIVLGLGSNIGDRLDFLNRAMLSLEAHEIKIVKKSHIYETKPIVLDSSPKEWKMPYLNMALKCKVSFLPEELLFVIKSIESLLGRKPADRWAPREIDIDILAYGLKSYYSSELVIPHKMLLQRDFAIRPFSEVWPDWTYPVKGDNFMKTSMELKNEAYDTEMKEFIKNTDFEMV